MIESIQFKNFKALRDTTLPLGPCTILVGPNGSGKTTVLRLLRAIAEQCPLDYHGIVTAGRREDEDARVSVRLICAPPFERACYEGSCRGGEALQFTPTGIEGREKKLLRTAVRRMRVYSFDASRIAAPVQLQKNPQLDETGAGLAAMLDGLRDSHPERFEVLNQELGRWVPEFDRILFDLDASGHRLLSLRTRDGHNKIRAADLSQGTLIALAILTLAYLPDPPSLIGLEEPDRGIHPHLLRHVQDALYRLSNPESCGEKRDPVQVIATTHSPCFLDLFNEHPEEIVVANKVGSDVQFQRVTDQPHFKEMLGDAPLGEAWHTGFFGGVPSGS